MKTNQKDIEKMNDKTFVLTVIIKKEDIQNEYQSAIKSIQANFEAKGFRKGKAPLDVVEQQVSKEHVVEDVASRLISKAYTEKVKELGLKPIIQPQVDLKNPPATFDKDWEIQLTSCELPDIAIDDKFIDEVKKINKEEPKKESKEIKEDKAGTENQKIDAILEVLVKHSKVTLPEILIESDIQHHLSHLVEQAESVGLTVAQYLKSKNQTLENYRESLKEQIQKEWTINLAISKIAETQKIEVSEKEVNDIVAQNPALSSNINFVYYLLSQQKVFDYLRKL
jgi:FKBP-type peptidyl-prolyl cis-trans isomerase (trigger factor)